MSIQIMGEDYDDLAQLMGADLIVLGTAVVGEVKTGSTFYAGSTVLLTGSGTQTLNPVNENVPAGYYAATTLSGVDGDLAVGNIKLGVTIFGFLGTYEGGALVEDVIGEQVTALVTSSTVGSAIKINYPAIPASSSIPLATKNLNFAAGCLAVGSGFLWGSAHDGAANDLKLELTLGGVLVAQSGYLLIGRPEPYAVIGTRALTGAQDAICRLSNDAGNEERLYSGWSDSSLSKAPYAVAVGSVIN